VSYPIPQCAATTCPTSCTGGTACHHPRPANLVAAKLADGTVRVDHEPGKTDRPDPMAKLHKLLAQALDVANQALANLDDQ
jgi:hypothetical protein